MNVARINCAHDEPSVWEKMVAHLRQAEAQTQRRCKILLDLAGPKIRTGPVAMPPGKTKVYRGDRILLTAKVPEASADISCQVNCSLPEVLAHLQVGASVWIDDGKIGARVVRIEPAGVVLEVDKVAPQGKKLRAEKGLNFRKLPGSDR
jgi:pyruvate kinase